MVLDIVFTKVVNKTFSLFVCMCNHFTFKKWWSVLILGLKWCAKEML